MTTRTTTRVGLAVLAALALVAAACQWRGPTPTEQTFQAPLGPFPIATATVPAGNGFGGGTIYYPTDAGPFGGVAVVPGFTATQSSISWYGPRIASQGFVVFTIDTISIYDFPPARGDQLLAALDYLTASSVAKGQVDPARLAVMGWSMGGGGALEAAKKRPSLKAAIPLAGWNTTTDWSSLTTPTMVVACQNDTIAPNNSHSTPFYNSLTTEKIYLEIAGGDHFCVTSPSVTVARGVLSWLKRWVDIDTRYDPFLCPAPADPAISNYVDTCPMG